MSVRPLSTTNNPNAALERLFRALELFKATEPKATTLMVQTFLKIAANPDEKMTQAELAEALGKVPAPMVHEVVGRLGTDTTPRFGTALGLIDIRTDPYDARAKRLALTRKGRTLAANMAAALRSRQETE